ncbi:MAG: hypothetical protein H6R19_2650 [Proteobacteria bacterium]|nr:hypothetical protein [Pseudomonadota bacterium]
MTQSEPLPAQHPIHLGFCDPDLEQAYLTNALPRTQIQGRLALAVGGLIYVLMGLLDHWFVPPEHQAQMWAIRLGTVWITPVIFALTYTHCFVAYGHLMLVINGLVGGLGVIAMIHLLPLEAVSYYYPGLMLVTFYTYNFSGARFIHAFCVDLILITVYNLTLLGMQEVPSFILISHDFFIISANLMGGTVSYLGELQRRKLFLQERALEKERQLHLQRSLHDPLTGLPNRSLLYDRISQALSLSQREGVGNAAYFIDLDGFKQINDELGHEFGDRVLKTVAQRLREVVRETDTVSRLAGDEFFVLARGLEDAEEARQLARKMLARIGQKMPGMPGHLALSASIGVCLFPYPSASVAGIIDLADQAMYRAKRSGKSAFALVGEERD